MVMALVVEAFGVVLLLAVVVAVGTHACTSVLFFFDRPRAKNKRFRRPVLPVSVPDSLSLDPPPMLSSLDLLLITIMMIMSDSFLVGVFMYRAGSN